MKKFFKAVLKSFHLVGDKAKKVLRKKEDLRKLEFFTGRVLEMQEYESPAPEMKVIEQYEYVIQIDMGNKRTFYSNRDVLKEKLQANTRVEFAAIANWIAEIREI